MCIPPLELSRFVFEIFGNTPEWRDYTAFKVLKISTRTAHLTELFDTKKEIFIILLALPNIDDFCSMVSNRALKRDQSFFSEKITEALVALVHGQ